MSGGGCAIGGCESTVTGLAWVTACGGCTGAGGLWSAGICVSISMATDKFANRSQMSGTWLAAGAVGRG